MQRVFGVLAVALVAVTGCEEADPANEASTSGATSSDDAMTSTGMMATSEGGTVVASSSSGDESGSSESTDGWVDIDCTEYCSDVSTEGKQLLCYACRCKNAMDGFMPSREQLQCSEADELTIFTADVSGPQAELVPLEGDSTTCANPALLTGRCGPGSRLGQIVEGDIDVKWICRDPDPDTGIFADAGAIMHNRRNGATCYFDDIDAVTTMDNWPALDFFESDQANFDEYLERFYFTDGNSCSTDCHDADPFIYTPYFRSIEWLTGNYVFQAYGRVSLDGSLEPVAAQHLVSEEVVMCRACHRLGSAAGCDLLTPDALGEYKSASHEQAILDATEPGSPNWKLAYWMPNGNPIGSYAMWNEMYGAAKQRISQCCMEPGVDTTECDWEPIPIE